MDTIPRFTLLRVVYSGVVASMHHNLPWAEAFRAVGVDHAAGLDMLDDKIRLLTVFSERSSTTATTNPSFFGPLHASYGPNALHRMSFVVLARAELGLVDLPEKHSAV